MHVTRASLILTIFVAIGLAGIDTPAQTLNSRVLIRTAKPYASVAARVTALGGHVLYQYRYVDAIAAELPTGALAGLRDAVGTGAILKDQEIAIPASVDALRGRNVGAPATFEADSYEALESADIAQLATISSDPDL